MAQSSRDRSRALSVESLRVFLEVVNRGGFTAAAKSLGITQPAVSLSIRRLEERVGASLFRRDAHPLTITAQGEELLPHAAEIIEAHDRTVDQMRRSPLSGEVRLGCNGEVAATGLAQVMGRFRRTHPDIDVMIQVYGSVTLGEQLAKGEIDIALMQVLDEPGAVRPTDNVWRYDELRFVQAHNADFADADPLPVVWFGPSGVYGHVCLDVLEAAGRNHRIAVECPHIPGAQRAIEEGLGIALLNTPNITEHMSLFTGIGAVELPRVAFLLRRRAEAGGHESIDALADHLTAALARLSPGRRMTPTRREGRESPKTDRGRSAG